MKAMKQLFAIHVHRFPVTMQKGKWIYEVEERAVEIMAISSGFAMVRRTLRKGLMPYICEIKDIRWADASSEVSDVS